MGDYIIDYFKNDHAKAQLKCILEALNLKMHLMSATRIGQSSSTIIIDYFWSNIQDSAITVTIKQIA